MIRIKFHQLALIFYYIWSAVIVVLMLIPVAGIGSTELGNIRFRTDYLLHAIAFFPLPLAAWLACNLRSVPHTAGFAGLVSVSVILGIGTEFLQIMVPGRSFNYMDIIFNITGIVSGIIVVLILRKHPLTRQWLERVSVENHLMEKESAENHLMEKESAEIS